MFTIKADDLLKQLQVIAPVVPSNPVVPILENFHFEVKGDELKATASNIQVAASVMVPVSGSDAYQICVPARILIDTLKNLSGYVVVFTYDNEKSAIQLSTEQGKYKMSCESGEDFPKMSEIKNGHKVSFGQLDLLEAFKYTSFAVSTDEMKPAMNGLYFDFPNKCVVGCDGHRLIQSQDFPFKANGEIPAVIAHSKVISLLRGLPATIEDVVMEYNNQHAKINSGAFEVVFRLIDERFPDYKNVIPTETAMTARIVREDLQDALKRLLIFAQKSTRMIKLTMSKGPLMTLDAVDTDFQHEAREQIDCEFAGADRLVIGINGKFLSEIVNSMDAETYLFKFRGPTNAILIAPDGEKSQNIPLALIMPMHITDAE